MRDYYCNQKFNWLKIDAEKKTTYSCCKAAPHTIDNKFLLKNPGMLFNTDKLQQERQFMLDNKRISGCENICWINEDKNLPSRRIMHQGYKRTHFNIISQPAILDITISGECNLTCSYCCKEYSSSWRNDLIKNGEYQIEDVDDNRYKINTYDLALSHSSQKDRTRLETYKIIQREIEHMAPHLQQVNITGGEPFLNFQLLELLEKLKNISSVNIFTGLGVDSNRFHKHLQKISKYGNVTLTISAESVGSNFEFNRHGNTWKKFLFSLELIKKNNISYSFNTTYSNLTVLDYIKFYELFANDKKSLNFVYEPSFMSISVLDNETKKNVIDQIENSNVNNSVTSQNIINSLTGDCTEIQRKNLEYFVKEFCKRRNIKPDFMPNTLKKWLNLA